MPNTSALPLVVTAAAAKARYEAMCADPRSYGATAWEMMAEILESAISSFADIHAGLADRALDCRDRANRIAMLRRSFDGAIGAGLSGGEAA